MNLQLCLAILGIVFALTDRTVIAADPPPNIILILTDDLGVGDISCYGGTQVKTPNIDRMAAEGTRFTQYYTASPICSPSRAGLITGMYPAHWQLTSFLQTRKGNRGCGQADFLDPKAPSLPRVLKNHGYATVHIGKWHLGGGRDVTSAPPFAAYGYDEHIGTYESPEPHPDITATNWIWSDQDKVKRWNRTAFFVEQTLDFLKRHKDKPCFINLWPDDPHTPWVPGPSASKGDTIKNLHGVLTRLDRQIGLLLEGIDKLGIANNTFVIFTSDNGPLPTFKTSRTVGLRGSKLSLYEGGIRVPFIICWPGLVPAGRIDDKTVLAAVDLFPTLCSIAGAPLPEGIPFDGQNLSSAFFKGPIERSQPLFWEYGRNNEFFSYPKPPGDRSPNVAMRDGRWKLLINADGTGTELYDLSTDPKETTNLAANQPDLTKHLADQALAWRKSLP